MRRALNELDTFKLLMQENIDILDNQVIFMLYQPIIGTDATTLYLTLLQEKQLTNRINLDFNHTRLMLLLNLDKIDLLSAFKKLELYKLMVSYYYPTKSTYIYDLKRPLSADLFFQNEKLNKKLLQSLGTLQYERQKYYFLRNEPEITDDFINVSDETTNEETTTSGHSSLQVMLNNLNKIDMPLSSFNNNLNHNSNYQAHANLEKETIININQNKTLFTNTLNQMQTQDPQAYLLALTKKPLDAKLSTTLQSLINDYQIPNGVINCLFEYVWFKNDKRIEPNYILKIAKTFQENKINTINDALKHLKLAYSKSKKRCYTNDNYQQNVLWTKDDDVNIDFSYNSIIKKTDDKKLKNGTMSQEEIKKILEEFDNH